MTEAMTVTNREQYLASNKTIRKVQNAYFGEMNREYEGFLKDKSEMEKREISAINRLRRIGDEMNGFLEEADIPGKQLTFDLHRQFAEDSKKPLAIPFDVSMAALAVCAHIKADITTTAEVWAVRQQVRQTRMALWDEAESARPPQERMLAPDEWGCWLTWLKRFNPVENIPKLMANENYFPDGHIRPDLREMYAEKWRPVFGALDKFRKELGI